MRLICRSRPRLDSENLATDYPDRRQPGEGFARRLALVADVEHRRRLKGVVGAADVIDAIGKIDQELLSRSL